MQGLDKRGSTVLMNRNICNPIILPEYVHSSHTVKDPDHVLPLPYFRLNVTKQYLLLGTPGP